MELGNLTRLRQQTSLHKQGTSKPFFLTTFFNSLCPFFSSANVVDMFESRLERKRKTLLGPPAGTVMIIFIDDINMPMLEFYGAQPPIELLRQVVDHGG